MAMRICAILICVVCSWQYVLTLECAADVVYVSSGAAGDNNGLSWHDAYNELQYAVQQANEGQEIWVAAGVYTPGYDRGDSFVMRPGICVYGGFSGVETNRDDRDLVVNITLLSGDIGVPGESGDNSHHIVKGADNAVLDGFIIVGGVANGDTAPDMYGAGLYNDNASPTIRNCTFIGNYALPFGSGGAIFNRSSSPVISNCVFSANSAYWGGAICNVGTSAPTLIDCRFIANAADYGGAVESRASSVTVTRCYFLDNYGEGGAIHLRDSACSVENSVFAGNSGGAWNGGGVAGVASGVELLSCTFNSGTAAEAGGGIHLVNSDAHVKNCLIWGNAATLGGEVSSLNSRVSLAYSLLEGGVNGPKCAGEPMDDAGGNISGDPAFMNPDDPAGPDQLLCTADDGLQLSMTSPCIDRGDSSGAPFIDITGYDRPQGFGVEMGAYEYDVDYDKDGLNNVLESNIGSNPYSTDSNSNSISDYVAYTVYGSSLLDLDTDGDGMPDVWEIAHGLNPYVNDADEDLDLDWISNYAEYLAGTNPANPDSNGDGISDYDAVHGEGYARYSYDRLDRLLYVTYSRGLALAYRYDGNDNMLGQAYTRRDEDKDGLPDYWEFSNGLSHKDASGVNGPAGDPDGDGWSNYQEWRAGTNPQDAASRPDAAPGEYAVYRQTPPITRIMPEVFNGAGLALVRIRVWDAEGNNVFPVLQYMDPVSHAWEDATILTLDGVVYTDNIQVSALATGSLHDFVWQADADIEKPFAGVVLLRARSRDLSAWGDWSVSFPYRLDILQERQLTVASAHGDPVPSVGVHIHAQGARLTNWVASPVVAGLTQYVCLGWVMEGQVPFDGATNVMTMTHTNDAVLTWLWQTNFWLEAVVNGQGMVDPGSGWFIASTNLALQALPANGWHFTGWSGDIPPDQTNNNPVEVALDQPLSVSASFEINKYTLSYSAGLHGSLDGEPVQVVDHGASGSAVLVCPTTGYHFVRWSDGNATNPRQDLNVDGDITVTAGYAVNQYLFVVESEHGEPLMPVGIHTNAHGAWLTNMVASPVGHGLTQYVCAGWAMAGNDPESGHTNLMELVHTNDAVLTWLWTTNFWFESAVTGQGAIDMGSEWVPAGTNLVLLAAPSNGWHFVCWEGEVDPEHTNDNPLTLLMNLPRSVTALFSINYYTLTYLAGVGGGILGDATQNVAHGDSGSQVVATPENGAIFSRWSDNSGLAERIDTNVVSDIDAKAFFQSIGGVPIDWYYDHGIEPEAGQSWADVDADDSDEDGVLNRDEYPADTDPSSADSLLKIRGILGTDEGLFFEWQGGTAAWQRISYSLDSATARVWQVLFTNLPLTPVVNSTLFEGVNMPTSAWFRIEAGRQ